MKTLLLILLVLILPLICNPDIAGLNLKVPAPDTRMCGLNFVAPPQPFGSTNPMPDVRSVHANWIAVIPYAFTRLGQPDVHFDHERQWWGERPEGVRETIRLAQADSIRVMLKPQVYVPRSWPGDLRFESDADWEKWEAAYRKYIFLFVDMAVEMKVPLFCIGTEFKYSEQERPDFWRQLIRDIRQVYDGQLTYAANWDAYDQVPFWNDLDFIGVNSYFPLSDSETPTVKELKKAWQPHLKTLRKFSHRQGKPMLFTEYGYLSVDGCAHKTWELEAKVKEIPINQQAQANALRAVLDVFGQENFWHGSFLWKWFPNMAGHEGYLERDYSPQNKLAEEVLRNCHQQMAN